MGPVARRIVSTAQAHPDWVFDQIAAHCCSTRGAVKVVLCCARQANLIRRRPGDGRPGRRPAWLPDVRLADYKMLRAKVGAAEARRMIKEEMDRDKLTLSRAATVGPPQP